MNNELNFSFHQLLSEIARLHFSLTHKTLEKQGLYPGQPSLLYALQGKDGLSQKELSDKLYLKPATVTVMIKRLEKSGFVKKRTDKNDQRISRIYLTEKGTKACTEVKYIISKIDKICLNNLDKDDAINFNNMLNTVKNNLKNCKESFE